MGPWTEAITVGPYLFFYFDVTSYGRVFVIVLCLNYEAYNYVKLRDNGHTRIRDDWDDRFNRPTVSIGPCVHCVYGFPYSILYGG